MNVSARTLPHHHCNIRYNVAVLANQVRYIANSKSNVFSNCRLGILLCGYNAITLVRFIIHIFVRV